MQLVPKTLVKNCKKVAANPKIDKNWKFTGKNESIKAKKIHNLCEKVDDSKFILAVYRLFLTALQDAVNRNKKMVSEIKKR